MTNKILDGLVFPYFLPEENFYKLRDMELGDNQLLMTTYPKSGTHWTLYTIYGILHPEHPPLTDSKSMHDYCPFLDELGVEKTKEGADDRLRMYLTHLPINYLKKNVCSRIVGVIRNPLDCCVSLYKFLEHMGEWHPAGKDVFRWTRDPDGRVTNDYFNDFVHGNMLYGDIFKYIKAMYERRDDPNVHIMIFEKMKHNPREETLNLARFLGHAEKIEEDNGKLLDKIVEQSSFENMKKVKFLTAENKEMYMMRKGEVGSYRESLSAEQIYILRNKMQTELAGTSLIDLWRNV